MTAPPRPAPSLVLASGSRYRRELLERLGLDFAVCVPALDERAAPGERPAALASRLAAAKAAAGAALHPGALVIGSDQVAELDGELLRKPETPEANVEQLLRCSGRVVTFHTALSLLAGGSERHDLVPYRVHFRVLRAAWIEAYVARSRALDCAGGFRVEGLGIALFERLEGEDPTALMGLPLIRLSERLRELGVEVLVPGAPLR